MLLVTVFAILTDQRGLWKLGFATFIVSSSLPAENSACWFGDLTITFKTTV